MKKRIIYRRVSGGGGGGLKVGMCLKANTHFTYFPEMSVKREKMAISLEVVSVTYNPSLNLKMHGRMGRFFLRKAFILEPSTALVLKRYHQ